VFQSKNWCQKITKELITKFLSRTVKKRSAKEGKEKKHPTLESSLGISSAKTTLKGSQKAKTGYSPLPLFVGETPRDATKGQEGGCGHGDKCRLSDKRLS